MALVFIMMCLVISKKRNSNINNEYILYFLSFVCCLDRKIVVEIENIIITFSGAFRKQFTDTFPFMFDHMFLIFAIAAFSLKLKTKIPFKLQTKYTNKKILKCFYQT